MQEDFKNKKDKKHAFFPSDEETEYMEFLILFCRIKWFKTVSSRKTAVLINEVANPMFLFQYKV